MCGICGIYGEIDSTFTIEAMMRKLEHRGPDDSSWRVRKHCAFGHRRLSILDLSPAGQQPMINEDGEIWLVVNGEIYNYKELRDQLKDSHVFYSESDSEVIVHAYEKWGESFVDHLRGMFALAIYDSKQDKLILARDPIGKKPLYYYWDGRRLVFASEIKALFEAGVPKAVNYDMIPTYLMYQYSLGTDTLFKGVKKLPAGTMLVSEPGLTSLGLVSVRQYWHIQENTEWDSIFDAHDELRSLLTESVKLRLQSDVPVGAFLSGGIDSSAVVALWREQSQSQIHTFTASFNRHSEAPYAKRVSDYLDTTYHEVPITPEMVARDIEKITWHHDEPLGDAAVINNYYLAKEAKKYVTVVLAGEGGDELFGGYPWHKWAKYVPMMNLIPTGLKLTGAIALDSFDMGNPLSPFYRLGRMVDFPIQPTTEELNLYPTTAMSWHNIQWLLKEDKYHIQRSNPILDGNMKNPLNKMLASDCLNLLPEKYLMKADKATMAWGIEERLPLLDKQVIEFAFSVPPAMKHNKAILRDAVRDLLPPEIVNRPKAGFGTPIREWMNDNHLAHMVYHTISGSKLLREICKPEALGIIERMTMEDFKPSSKLSLSPVNIVWTLFALGIWDKVWFNG